MHRKYNDVSDYMNDLKKSITLINESMKTIEEEFIGFSDVDTTYFNCRTSSGLSFLLKKYNVDSDLLASRLRVANDLIKNANIDYSDYKKNTKSVLSEIEENINIELKRCRNKLFNAKNEEINLLYTKEFFLDVYNYIIRNVFFESFNYTCDEKIKERPVV
ncbi:MAG: hypothetical protein ABF289_19535 [Clostridiales bacterium]